MSIVNLLKLAADAGVFISYAHGELRFKLSVATFPEALREQILANRDAIAAFLREHAAAAVPAPIVPRGAEARRIPLSPAQRSLWFVDRLDGGSAPYTMSAALHVRGRFDAAAAQTALRRLVQRHAPLRTLVREDADGPYQLLRDDVDVPLPLSDLRALAQAERDAALQRLLAQHTQLPFDLSEDVLLRAQLLLLSAEEAILLLTVHHIACDGWSIGILGREFAALYDAARGATEASLPALAVDYADYALWQQQRLHDPALQQQLVFWRDHLRDAPLVHGLATDFARPPRQLHRGAGIEVMLDAASWARARRLAQSSRVTATMLLHAVFAVLLARSSGGSDIVVGMPVANRSPRELEGLVGYFVNLLALRCRVDGALPFADFLQQIRAIHHDAQANQELPFDLLVEALNPPRSPAHSPLLQIVLAHESDGDEVIAVDGATLTRLPLPSHSAKFDVQLTTREQAGGLCCHFEYDRALFAPATVQRLAEGLTRLLAAVVATPDCPLGALPLRDPAAPPPPLEQALAADLVSGELLHELFERQAAATPDAVALACGAQRQSYAVVNAQANRLASLLRAHGVQPDSRIGVCLPRSIELVVGLLAVLKAGAAYVPLDPDYPAQRLDFLVRDSALTQVVTLSALASKLPPGQALLCLDNATVAAALAAATPHDLPRLDGQDAASLAYVIHTSGSSGMPKGVQVEHRQVQRLLAATQQHFDFGRSDVWTLFHSCAFDFSVWEIWGALAYGGRLVVVPQAVARAPQDFHALLVSEDVTVLNQTPTAFAALAAVDARHGVPLALRWVIFGGEALNLGELKDWVRRRGDNAPQLVNMYGITETTVHVTWRRIRAADIDGGIGSVIGRPLADLSIHLLDGQGQRVPDGVPGEICVAGGGLARGYLNRPELTAQRFVDNPLRPGERLYRSGDLARYRADGELEYVGRSDAQLKIRGYRIEPGEIEQQLSALDGVGASVVLARDDGAGHRRLVAYVVAAPALDDGLAGGAASALVAGWRDALASRLPDYLVPSAFVLLPALPLTANGKVDRSALPAPDVAVMPGDGYVAARTPVETALCEVWQQVLGRERVGVDDNFFSIGGDSIVSIRIVGLLQARGLAVDVKDIFHYQTIAQLALHVGVATDGDTAPERFALLTEIEREGLDDDIVDAYPLSALQAGMVFHTQLERFSGIYHNIIAQPVDGAWDEECFTQALRACVDEQPVLRSGFRLDGARPLQLVRAAGAVPLAVEDLRKLTPAQQDAHLAAWTETHKRRVFDWERGPLWSIHVLRCRDDAFVCVLSKHHAVLDGWSCAQLLTTLCRRYAGLLAGDALPAPLAVDWTFRRFVALELQAQRDAQAAAHFATQLAGVPELQIPRLPAAQATPAGGALSRRGGQSALAPFGALSAQVIALSQQLGVAVQSVVLAAHFKVLSQLSGSARVCSCVTSNGRPEQAGAERGLGLFLNSLPLALTIAPGSWRELILQLAAASTANLVHRRYPLAQIQRDLGRRFSEVTLNYMHFHVYAEAQGGSGPAFDVHAARVFEETNFDFHVDVSRHVDADVLELLIRYDADLYAPERVERIGAAYLAAFRQMLDNVDASHDVPGLPPLIDTANPLHGEAVTAAAECVPDGCVHHAFEAQVRRTPDALAAACGEQVLSYRELDERAARLARYLLDSGISSEARIGLHLPRSLELLIGVLGVLKAGATYVPLEPELPAQRIAYLLSDANIASVLSSSAGVDALPLQGIDVLLMDGAASDPSWLQECAGGELPVVNPDQLAYVLYTSGSTGQPKGVMVPHRAVANYLDFAVREYLGEGIMGAVVSSPLCFDATLTTLLPPLLCGKPVVLLPDDETMLQQLASRLFASETEWLFKITPAHLEALAYLERPVGMGLAAHCIVVGGEQFAASTLRQWKLTLLPNASFVNEYGPTETVVGCSIFRIDDADTLATVQGAATPIGKPIANTQLYVLGEGMRRQPAGAIGELYIGGAGVTAGYLNRPELTAERFVHNPFGNEPDSRLYRSGDRVRRLADGNLVFLGRNDDQVKIRGFRIELGEIEHHLQALDGVREAAVLVRGDTDEHRQLVAYLVPADYPDDDGERQVLDASLVARYRQALVAQLPNYMLPQQFVLLGAMPLTVNGKLDRRALAQLARSDMQSAAYIAARTPAEQVLCEVWQQVLARDRVGIADNFFSLGGDSILSIRMAALLQARGYAVEMKSIFQYQTVEQLALQLIAADARPADAALQPFALLTAAERAHFGDGIDDAYPLSVLQAGMVFHTQLAQFNGIYHDIMTQHVRCPWDRPAFAAALASCVAQYPVLRTTFLLDGTRPLQRVHKDLPLPLVVEDWRGLNADGQQRRLAEWTEARKRHEFDWAAGPLFQIDIFLCDDEHFVFIVSFHHAILDGWSRATLMTTLYRRYLQALAGQPLESAATDWIFREFVAEELAILSDTAARRHFAQLLDDAPLHQLPRRHADGKSGIAAAAGLQRRRVDAFAALSEELLALAATLGVPLQALLLAAHYKMLACVSGRRRVASCVTQHARPATAAAEHGLGLFLNALPQCIAVAPGSWREWILRVAAQAADSVGFRTYPLARIQQELGWPFSEVLFNYTHFHVLQQVADDVGGAFELLRAEGFEQTNFDLSVDISRGIDNNRLELDLVYDSSVFDDALIERAGRCLVEACRRMVAAPGQAHDAGSLLDPAEIRRLRREGQGAQATVPALCLHTLFEQQVARTPGARALAAGEQSLSYRELEARANQLAHVLRERGVGPDVAVAVALDRGVELVVALLAVLKAGGAYVPLDPAYPAARWADTLADCRPALAITQRRYASRVAAPLPCLLLDEEAARLADRATHNPADVGVQPHHLAYVIYTSGSTGTPKGVMIEHRSVVNLALALQQETAASGDGGWAWVASCAFDASVQGLTQLALGRTLIIVDDDSRYDVSALGQLLTTQRPALADCTPALLQLWLDAGLAAQLPDLVVGGEAITPVLWQQLVAWQAQTGRRAFNVYGPTECCVNSTGCRIAGEQAHIGRAWPNGQVYVLDDARQPVPPGTPGELYIGGVGVGRGYLGRPSLTQERFVADPFDAAARIYRSGDRVRLRHDGNLEFLGRSDEQVKLRGFRIEPGEIEQQLCRCGGVQRALVIAREDRPGQKQLVAYIVPAESSEPADATIARLRQQLAEQLPDYMQPAAYVLLERLPLTTGGKTDRAALPAPAGEALPQYVAPAGVLAQQLAQIWAGLLQRDVEQIGARADFFGLGGHSLLAMQLVARVRAETGRMLTLRDVFDAPSLAAMAQRLESRNSTSHDGAEPHIPLADRTAPLPLSYSQQRLWAVDQMGGSAQYHLPVALRLDGMLDAAALQWAVEQVVARHEVLRTTLVADGGATVQKIAAAPPLAMAQVDLTALDDAAQREEVLRQVQQEAQRPFRLDRDLPLRMTLLRLANDSQILLFTMHHIVADAWSFGVLVRELNALYSARVSDSAAALSPLPVQYADFAQWQRSWLQSDAARAALDYWREQLADSPPLHDLPLDRPRPPRQGMDGRYREQQLDGELATALEALSRREGATLFMLLQTAFALLVSRYSQKHDVVIGTPVAGRTRAELEPLIGFFINYLPLRSRFEENLPLTTVLAQQKQMLLDAYSQQELPFQQMVEALSPPRSLAYDPIIQLVFGLDMSGADRLELGDLQLRLLRQPQTPAKVDLEVTVTVGADGLSLGWLYRTDLFDDSTIAGFATSYERLLRGIVAQPECGIFDYVLDEAVEACQGGEVHEPAQACVHHAFEAQVRRTPDALAAACGEQVLSYRELDERAARLARYLLDSGVGSEARIGLHLPRSLELLIGVLGVLKAGATYVPLEPELPAQRIAYLLSDANIVSVLSSSAGVDALPLQGIDVLLMDGAASDSSWLQECAGGELPVVNPEQLAYVLYTSGSTGQPKGVMVPHRAVANYLDFAVREYLGEGITGAVVSSPLCFDATLTTLLPPLLCGKPVVLLPDDETVLQQLASRLFASETAWLFKITPAHLEALAYLERPVEMGLAAHCIVVGGEQFAASTLRQWKLTLLPNASFVNEYGPTETVVGCSIFRIDDAETLATVQGAATPIGKPISNTQLYVLRDGMHLQPAGAVGELYIGGAGVTAGYLNRQELMAERFVRNPFSLDPRSRLYRSGDRVRRLADGNLMFLGRNDDQVKIRGFRIELGEIEHHLQALDGVREAAVLVRGDADAHRHLVAYVVPAGYPEDDSARQALDVALVARYRQALAAQLPDYLLPRTFVLLAAMPLTPNGKRDQRRLAALPGSDGQAAVTVAPRNAREQLLCEVWQEVLRCERVGIADNFFSLGGDSIVAIRVVSRLKERGHAVTLPALFQYQTIEQLAPQLTPCDGSADEEPALSPFALLTAAERAHFDDTIEDAYPLSALQAGMVFHTQLAQFDGIYHDIMADQLRCRWDRDAFEQALAGCVAEHPILRSGFVLDGVRPLQQVFRSLPLPVVVEDWRALDAATRQARLDTWLELHKRREFDWSRGPLWQVHIFLCEDDCFHFVLSFHHAVLDGWSRATLTTQLYQRYARLLAGQPTAPVVTDWTYRNFIAAEQRGLADVQARDFFARLLEDAPQRQIPQRRQNSRTIVQSRHPLDGFAALSGSLIGLARRLGVPVQALLLAAHFKVLACVSGQRRVLSCVTQHGRPAVAGAERGLGLFLNALPQCVDVDGGSWREWILSVAALGNESLRHRAYPLGQIQQDLGLQLSEVLFNYTHFHNYREFGDVDGGAPEVLASRGFEQTNFAFSVDVSRGVDDDRMLLELIYDSERYDAGLIERMGQYYLAAFRLMLADPERPHAALALTGAGERQRLLALAQAPLQMRPALAFHQLFEAQVRRTPDLPAVAADGRSLSYAVLNRQANRVAGALRRRGVGPDVPVALCLERHCELLVAMLGVLKAGGACLPLDPAYPAERLAQMLDDAQPGLVLAETATASRLPVLSVPSLLLDANSAVFDAEAPDDAVVADVGVTARHLAYLIFTSGSTGRAKSVQVEHGNLVNYVLGVAERFGFEAGLRHAMVSTVAADLGHTVLFGALASGGCVHLLSAEQTSDAAAFAQYLRCEAIDVLKITPSHLQALLGDDGSALPRHLLILGGEAAALPWIRQLQTRAPGCVIHNHYGPTETTVGVLTHCMDDDSITGDASATAGLPLGRPLPNVRAYIVGVDGQLAPWGTPGELWIGGAAVSRGYRFRDDLSAERFAPDPFLSQDGARVYRSGDRCRYRDDGAIEFLGRLDEQVKIRGFRVEPGEIEAALSHHPDVREAAVVVSGPAQELQLAAHVVPRDPRQAALAGKATFALPGGLPVAHLNRNETEYLIREIFTLQAYLRHGIRIADGDCIVDVGANIGLFSVFASLAARNLSIYAFEPNPVVFELLAANARAHGERVRCFPFGLAAREGSATMTFFEDFSLLSGFYGDEETERRMLKTFALNETPDLGDLPADLDASYDELLAQRLRARTVEAPLRTLSAVVAQEGIERIDLLKVNVEKSEMDVLQGLQPQDWAKVRQLVVEVDVAGNLQPILALLAAQGFDTLVEQDALLRGTELCYVYAIRPSAAGVLQRQADTDGHRIELAPAQPWLSAEALRRWLEQRLPPALVPASFTLLPALPLTANGKVDRKRLAQQSSGAPARPAYAAPQLALEQELCELWKEVLGVEHVGIDDNFFDAGGNSLSSIRLRDAIRRRTGQTVALVTLFEHPTVRGLARHLSDRAAPPQELALPAAQPLQASAPIAIVGMALRFPGAVDVESYWRNIAEGVETLTRYTDAQMLAAGVPASALDDPALVKSGTPLPDIDAFDAAYFGMSPREAEVTDPQQRLLLECAVEALEHAGYGELQRRQHVGVFVGTSDSMYLLENLLNAGVELDSGAVTLGNSRDYVATRVAYKLNLSGPALTVSTSCSTSLVAIHQACNSLRLGECSTALAGGATVHTLAARGYRYVSGQIYSPDGHCRAFDRDAAGTRNGDGAAVVMLKPLAAALADGDTVHAVIRGSAINNDAADKVGYMAPGVTGQAEAIRAALHAAGVDAASIGYVEAHGTGTRIGDPIEIRALTRAFGPGTPRSCALGSVKPNVGHLGMAAGVAGLIKAVQALKHRQLPPSINFRAANPEIDFDAGPFYVNTQLRDWPAAAHPRRAGVSSFGVGGTNAHVIVEEAPAAAIDAAAPAAPAPQLLLLSARSEAALHASRERLAAQLRSAGEVPLADIAFTLQAGRAAWRYRQAWVCDDLAAAIRQLDAVPAPSAVADVARNPHKPAVVLLFPGQGAQYAGMTRGLYHALADFRRAIDDCAALLQPLLGLDLRELLYPEAQAAAAAQVLLDRTDITQAALFTVEYALAQLLLARGLQPVAMLGHSLGEYVAACVAGVFTLQDGLRLVVARGRAMQRTTAGAMVAIATSAQNVTALLADSGCSVAAFNADDSIVAAGTTAAVDLLVQRAQAQGLGTRRLRTAHAFHSALMDEALPALREVLAGIALQPPQRPYLSNLTGQFVTPVQATDVNYWLRQLRQPVQFAAGVATVLATLQRRGETPLFIEAGPDGGLRGFVRQQGGQLALPLLRHRDSDDSDQRRFLETFAALWKSGIDIDWQALHAQPRRRVPLPAYPFQRRRYWIERAAGSAVAAAPTAATRSVGLYLPSWQQRPLLPAAVAADGLLLVLGPQHGVGAALAASCSAAGRRVIRAVHGERYERCGDDYVIDAAESGDYARLLADLQAAGDAPARLLVDAGADSAAATAALEPLCRALTTAGLLPPLIVLARGLWAISDGEVVHAQAGGLAAACESLPARWPGLDCRLIDLGADAGIPSAPSVQRLAAEALQWDGSDDWAVAWRGSRRWVRGYQALPLPTAAAPALWRRGGRYLIVGALQQAGLALAEHLTTELDARLVLFDAVAVASDAAVQQVRQWQALDRDIELVVADAVEHSQWNAALARVVQRGPFDGIVRLHGAAATAAAGEALCVQACFDLRCRALSDWRDGGADYADAVDGAVAPRIVEVYCDFGDAGDAGDEERRSVMATEDWPPLLRRLPGQVPSPLILSTVALRSRIVAAVTTADVAAAAHARPDLAQAYAAPRDPAEEVLARIWQDVLGVAAPGVFDSFLELGGDSLLAVQLFNRIQVEFAVDTAALPLRQFFEQPTIATLAAMLAGVRAAKEAAQLRQVLADSGDVVEEGFL